MSDQSPVMKPPLWLSTFCVKFVPGAAHALTTVVVGSPFDTVKTRVQVGMHSSPLQCAYSTVQQEGPLALYRGAWMPLVSLMVKRPFEFAAFEWCNEKFGSKTQGPFVGGFVAGVLSSCLGCPFNVVKVQMQANRQDVYRHTFEVLTDVWQRRGPVGFYRGFGASLIMSVPSTTFYLGAYGYLREALPSSKQNTAIAGMCASLCMWSCLLPLDNIKTNIQAKPFLTGDGAAYGWSRQLLEIVRGPRGVLGLWAGWSAVVIRAPLMSGVAMLAYEQARSTVDEWQR